MRRANLHVNIDVVDTRGPSLPSSSPYAGQNEPCDSPITPVAQTLNVPCGTHLQTAYAHGGLYQPSSARTPPAGHRSSVVVHRPASATTHPDRVQALRAPYTRARTRAQTRALASSTSRSAAASSSSSSSTITSPPPPTSPLTPHPPQTPSNITHTPSNITHTPSNTTHTPSNTTHTPSNTTHTPSNTTLSSAFHTPVQLDSASYFAAGSTGPANSQCHSQANSHTHTHTHTRPACPDDIDEDELSSSSSSSATSASDPHPPWTPAQDSLLLAVYQNYTQDPTIAPFTLNAPPSGAVQRVAKLAIRQARLQRCQFPHPLHDCRQRLRVLVRRPPHTLPTLNTRLFPSPSFNASSVEPSCVSSSSVEPFCVSSSANGSFNAPFNDSFNDLSHANPSLNTSSLHSNSPAFNTNNNTHASAIAMVHRQSSPLTPGSSPDPPAFHRLPLLSPFVPKAYYDGPSSITGPDNDLPPPAAGLALALSNNHQNEKIPVAPLLPTVPSAAAPRRSDRRDGSTSPKRKSKRMAGVQK